MPKKKPVENVVGQKLRDYLKDNHDVELPDKATMTEFVNAYLQAKGAEVVIGHRQSMNVIALDLTSFCNLKCFGCNHFLDEVQTKEKLDPRSFRAAIKIHNLQKSTPDQTSLARILEVLETAE